MTDPQTAADAAERVPLTAAQEARAYLSTPVTSKWFGRELVSKLLAEHDEMAAELEQVRRERAADDEHTAMATSLVYLLVSSAPCRLDRFGNCLTHGEAVPVGGDCPHALAKAFLAGAKAHRSAAMAASAAPDATGDMQTGERRADGKRTPEQWCAEYGIDIADPDGWRNTGDPAWDEPITLPDFLRRAARSTCRGLTPDVWNRLSREAHEAADAERPDAEGAEKGPESHGDAISSADRPSA